MEIIKSLKLFTNKFKSIESLCDKYKIYDFKINNDKSIDVNGPVGLQGLGLYKLPLKFNIVTGSFNCADNNLVSLEGCPKEVGDIFLCNNNNLKTLEYSPEYVRSFFCCCDNKITNLKHITKKCNGNYLYHNNPLPQEIFDAAKGHYFKNTTISFVFNKIVEYQDDYSIWKPDGILDKFRFNDMMLEILENEQ